MKILFILLISTFLLKSDGGYYVVYIQGNPILKSTHKPLKIGDKISENDGIIFNNKSEKVSIVSPVKGRFDLFANKAREQHSGELLTVLKSSLLPSVHHYYLATRSINLLAKDPKIYFNQDDPDLKYLLINDQPFNVINSYKMDNDNFFFLQYTLNKKTILKKIPVSDHALIFNKHIITDENNNVVENIDQITDCVIAYQYVNEEAGVNSRVIAKFKPVFVNKGLLGKEISLLRKNLTVYFKGNKNKINQDIYDYVNGNYGFIPADDIVNNF
ncbi:MAG TPA: hypothetical protein VIM16_09785 [Mucilaginibacter sp.]|jgi:hypothetical protein